jgi:hypothetical protein
MNNYVKFGVMMLTSFVLMYGIMFLNVASVDHVYFSLMRNYMTLLMVSVMAFTMLLFMWSMYKNIKINVAILVGSVLIFGLTLFGVRTQTPISDVQWMQAMIPHHSSAILTSSQVQFSDPEVQKLADEIIEAQVREIEQMKAMIKRLE